MPSKILFFGNSPSIEKQLMKVSEETGTLAIKVPASITNGKKPVICVITAEDNGTDKLDSNLKCIIAEGDVTSKVKEMLQK